MADQQHLPMFARARAENRTTVELRAEIPRSVMDVIDAHWMSRPDAKSSRNAVVNEILTAWAVEKWHEASLMLQMVPSNPTCPDSEEGAHA